MMEGIGSPSPMVPRSGIGPAHSHSIREEEDLYRLLDCLGTTI